jgi:hypothetical protein
MKGFVSYSHDDYGVVETFKTHLRAIELAFDVQFWWDNRISTGYHWDAAIQRGIAVAEIFVLLMSSGFIGSGYINNAEIPAIRERAKSPGTVVLPVVLERCFWQLMCGNLQAAPTHHGRLKPIADWRPRTNGFDRTRQQIADAIQNYYAISPKTIDWPVP